MLYFSRDFIQSVWRYTKLSHSVSRCCAKLQKQGRAAPSQLIVLEWSLGVQRTACVEGALALHNAVLIGQQTNSFLVSYGLWSSLACSDSEQDTVGSHRLSLVTDP